MKTFTKRVYFPVISIMLVTNAHLTLQQIAIMGATAAVVQGILQLPSGYFADKFGNRLTMLIGATIALPSALIYALAPNFWGGLFGLAFYTAGLAFISGAGEAFMHDTLLSLDRANDYSKEVGRAQSIALGGNFVLVSLVPLTYAIDFRLPFVIGFLSSILLVFSIFRMVEPIKQASHIVVSPIDAMKKIVTWQNVSLLLFAGLTGGVVERVFDFSTLALVNVGIAPQLVGFVAAISSIVGAVLGWYIFIFDKLPSAVFYFIDLVLVTLLLGLQATANVVVVVLCFVLFLGYARVRYIVFQSKLLKDLNHKYKATIISSLSFFGMLGGVVTMLIFSKISASHGLLQTLGYFSVTIFCIGLVLWVLVLVSLRSSAAHREAHTKSV
jgi:MFS family permease